MSKIKLKTDNILNDITCSESCMLCDLGYYDHVECKVNWGRTSTNRPWVMRPSKKCPLYKTVGTFVIDTDKHW